MDSPPPVSVLAAACLLVASLGCGRAGRPEGAPPNIVVVIADDLGWRDAGFMGSEVARTPHLDSLAASGTVFTHAFTTASACRPSLRTLLTGLEPQRLTALAAAMREHGERRVHLAAVRDVDTIPRALASRGYVSFQGGKHWEGDFAATGFTEGMARGYDLAAVRRSGRPIEMAGGASTQLGRRTMAPLLDFLDAHADEPFLVWFAPMLPHTPHDAAAAFETPYEDEPGLSDAARRYYANVSRFDARVGELLEHLDALGLRDDTLVLFLSDNGWAPPDSPDAALPLLGGAHAKLSIREDGFRTPMIVSWPGTLPSGRRDDSLVSALDVMPTLLDFAGVETPPGRNGLSLRGLLEGRGPIERDHLIVGMEQLRAPADEIERSPGTPLREEPGFFLREPGWRYVWIPGRGIEALYAIDDDPAEQHDVAPAHPDRVARARTAVEAWRARMREPAPVRGDAGSRGQSTPSSM